MKKGITIFLVILITFQSALWGVYLIIRKEHNYKQTIKSLKKISKTNLLELSFTQESFDALNWVKPGKEFIVNEDFYDIVSQTKNGNTIKIVCYKDLRDTEIAKELKNISRTDKKSTKILSKFLDLKYFEHKQNTSNSNFLIIKKEIEKTKTPKIIFRYIDSPPPKFSV